MRFTCRTVQTASGNWSVRYDGTDLGGPFEVTAPTRDQAHEKMRHELQYRLEFCPCTGETYKDVEIELREGAGG